MSEHFLDSWELGPDGVRFREAARVLLFDQQDRVLLMRGHDGDQPDRHWWFTVGGGIDPGEDPRAAAVREVFEETGIQLSVEELTGPVIIRDAVFDFAREHCRQHEIFFVARIQGGSLTQENWSDYEAELIDELRWLSLAELAALPEDIYPEQLPQIIAQFLSPTGWDGETHYLEDAP